MKKKKIKNPLIRRIPKELIGDWKKYLVVFLFLVLTIGFVSGMYVANGSMLKAAECGLTQGNYPMARGGILMVNLQLFGEMFGGIEKNDSF